MGTVIAVFDYDTQSLAFLKEYSDNKEVDRDVPKIDAKYFAVEDDRYDIIEDDTDDLNEWLKSRRWDTLEKPTNDLSDWKEALDKYGKVRTRERKVPSFL